MPSTPPVAPPNDPFFILFASRSGSTFLANELMRRADVCVFPETNFVTRLLAEHPNEYTVRARDLDRLLDAIYSDVKFQDWGLDRTFLRQSCGGLVGAPLADLVRHI